MLDYRSKGPRFDPRLRHEDFLRVRDTYNMVHAFKKEYFIGLWLSTLQEQYDYLHHAVLHSLTFDCRSIAGDIFLQNYNKLIERNGGKRIIDIQFQVWNLQLYIETVKQAVFNKCM